MADPAVVSHAAALAAGCRGAPTPSWWNLRHTLWLLGITGGVLLAVMVWVVVLGRRLQEQMAHHSPEVEKQRGA